MLSRAMTARANKNDTTAAVAARTKAATKAAS
jgi:hypothetical protein